MEEMKPGPELDALVAEKVMGLVPGTEGCWCDPKSSYGGQLDLQPYSTDIAAAWEVVEKVSFNLELIECEEWIARFGGHAGFGETAPHAICLAALKSVEK